jgi:hypothetical protein
MEEHLGTIAGLFDTTKTKDVEVFKFQINY